MYSLVFSQTLAYGRPTLGFGNDERGLSEGGERGRVNKRGRFTLLRKVVRA